MSTASRCPSDFRLVFHDSLSDSYELSKVLLATADFDGTLQLLTSGWERVLGYGREELEGKTLARPAVVRPARRRAAGGGDPRPAEHGPGRAQGALQEWPREMLHGCIACTTRMSK